MMKKRFVVMVAVVALVFAVFAGVHQVAVAASGSSETTEKTDTSYSIVDIPSMEDYDNIHEWFDDIEEVSPENKAKCPFSEEEYGFNKCVGTVHFAYSDGTSSVWDLYVVLWDGIEGVVIVNDSGNTLSFYGDMYDHTVENYNVHLKTAGDNGLCVYPHGENLESFMVVTYTN